MTDTASIEEILSKFAGNQIDSKEFLKLLLTSDDSGIDYLQNLKKEFKEDYVTPVFKKITDHYKKLNNVLSDEEAKKQVLSKLNDPLGIVSLNREYKEKTKDILDKQLKNLNNTLKIDKEPITEKIKNNPISAVVDDKQVVGKEQATLGKQEETISLSEKTIEQLANVFSGLNAKLLKDNKKNLETQPEQGNDLFNLLLLGGAGALLVSMFWKDHIKPWLEEKVNMKLDFLDRFEGTLEGIAKFFTLGGLKISGVGVLGNLVGKAFTTFGELLESSLSAIFKLGFGDEVIEAGAKAAPSTWKTLIPKVAGGLFKGAGLVAFKAIPIIGSLISFYFAYDRFQKGDTIGGIIDIANGIVGFIPYAGVPFSLGLSALNAFLDYKAGSVESVDAKQSMKMDYIAKITDYISNIPVIGGIISSFIGFAEWGSGIISGNTGRVKGGLLKMTKLPLFGIFPSIMLSLLDASTNNNNEFTGFDFNKFISKFRQDTLKTILSWFPEEFGLRKKVSDFMGVDYDGNYVDAPVISDTPEQKRKNLEAKNKKQELRDVAYKSNSGNEKLALSITQEKLNELNDKLVNQKTELTNILKKINSGNLPNPSDKDAMKIDMLKSSIEGLERSISRVTATREQKLDNAFENYSKKINPFSSSVEPNLNDFKIENKQDFSFKNLMSSTNQNSILFDKSTNTANILDKEDNILAYKKDGVFDLALQELTKLVASINKGIYKIPESLENMPVQTQPIAINSGSSSNSSDMSYVLGGTRDPIYEFRVMARRA